MAEISRLFRIAAICLTLVTTSATAHARFVDLRSCRPQGPNLFRASPVNWLFEDTSKLSQDEFLSLPITPAGVPVVAKGFELNVVFDPVCVVDPQRGPRQLPWLFEQREKISQVISKNSPRSVQWKLERDYEFAELQRIFESEPCVEMVSPDGKYFLTGSLSDPFVANQPHLKALRYDRVFSSFLLPMMVRKPVTIAVIDTGIDFNHPDLRLNKWINHGEVADNGIDDDRNGYVDDINGFNFYFSTGDAGPKGTWDSVDHGTHVAGLAAARFDNGVGGSGIHGVAKLMSLAVFDDQGYSRSSLVENAIRYAADHGAELINLSLGGPEYSRTMRSALQYAIGRGAFIVAAAGNHHREICDDPLHPSFISPAAYGSTLDGMIVVASTDTSDGRLSSFSNYSNRLIDVAAPGAFRTGFGVQAGLLSTSINSGYSYHAGTSMAAPLVTGAGALALSWLKAYGYDTSPARLETILKSSAATDSSLTDYVQQGRVLNLESLLSYLKVNYPPQVPMGSVP